jgi:hypothetical protein
MEWSSFEIDVKSTNFSGMVEDWVFWEWNERKTAEEIEQHIAESMVHPWIRIMKERSRYKYRYDGASLLPVLNKDDSNCSIEITTLNLKDNKNAVWWSVGIVLFAGKQISKDERKDMKVITQYLLSNYPEKQIELKISYLLLINV